MRCPRVDYGGTERPIPLVVLAVVKSEGFQTLLAVLAIEPCTGYQQLACVQAIFQRKLGENTKIYS